MGFKQVTQQRGKIGGFWTREEGTQVVGQVKKFVATDTGGFWIIQSSEGNIPLQGPDDGAEGRDSVNGEIVAVSGSQSLECLKDFVDKGIVRLSSNGKKSGKKGKTFWDIQVEHDPDGQPFKGKAVEYNEDDIPF